MKLHFLASFTAAEPTGDAWPICFIEEGEVAGRGWGIYARGLEASLPKFENVWVQAFRFEGKMDHLPQDVRKVFPSGVITDNIVGIADTPILASLPDGRKAVTGLFRPATEKMRNVLRMAQQAGKLNEFGLSINGDVTDDAHIAPKLLASGKQIQEVLAIDELYSTDMVTYPGGGGGIREMLASFGGGQITSPQQPQETSMLINEIKSFLTARGIAYTDDPSPLNLLASVPVQAAADVTALLKALKDALENGLDDVALQLLSMAMGVKPAEDKPDEEPKGEEDMSAPENKKGAVQASAGAPDAEKINKLDLLLSKQIVKDALDAEAGFSPAVKTLIASKFAGRVVNETDIKAEIEHQKQVLALATDSGKPRSFGTGVLLEASDKSQIAMYKLLGVQPTDAEKSEWQGIEPFKGLRAAYHHYTGDGERVTGRLLASNTMRSTDFPQALGDTMHRRLIQEYREAMIPGLQLVSVESVSDFRNNYVIQMGGLEDLAEVTETGGYGEAATPSDSEASYDVATYGKHIRVTRRLIKNDKVGALDRIVKKIRRAAVRSLNKFIFDLLLNYSGSINGGTIYDAKALYHADHANIQTGAISATNIWALRSLINAQLEADSSEPLDLEPWMLIVPKELEKTAIVALQSPLEPGDMINDINVITTKKLQLMVVDKVYLRNDANNYYMIGDPKDAEGIVIGFMDGQQEPELFLQSGPTEGNVFDYDHITYKVRHEYGGCVVDYRPLAASIVA